MLYAWRKVSSYCWGWSWVARWSSESTARASMTLSSPPRLPRSILGFPRERPELQTNAIELLQTVDVTIARIATDLQMTPKHIRRLADIDGTQPKLTYVGNPRDRRQVTPAVTRGDSSMSDIREERADMAHRSAKSGRYISAAAAARHPRASVAEIGGNKSSGVHNPPAYQRMVHLRRCGGASSQHQRYRVPQVANHAKGRRSSISRALRSNALFSFLLERPDRRHPSVARRTRASA